MISLSNPDVVLILPIAGMKNKMSVKNLIDNKLDGAP